MACRRRPACTARTPSPSRSHRRLDDRGGEHRHALHARLPERQAVQPLADQHGQAGRQHAERNLPDHREGQSGADEGARLQAGGALVRPVHLERRLPARRVLVGGPAGLHQRQPRLREHASGRCQDLLQDGGPRGPGHGDREPAGRIWDNGWTEWFLPWSKYVKGSALHEAVEAGPQAARSSARRRWRPRRRPRRCTLPGRTTGPHRKDSWLPGDEPVRGIDHIGRYRLSARSSPARQRQPPSGPTSPR